MSVRALSSSAVEALLQDPSAKVLGEGAFGRAYSVVYEGRKCVVKLGLFGSSGPNFRQECDLLEELGGAGGAPIPLGFCPDLPALIMTLCGSENMFRFIRRSLAKPSLLVAMTLGLRVTERLQEIHSKRIAHCDLKTDNVTLQFDSEGEIASVHLVDFGQTSGACAYSRTSPCDWSATCWGWGPSLTSYSEAGVTSPTTC
nr:casein kinase I-like [Penaeus vannamei]